MLKNKIVHPIHEKLLRIKTIDFRIAESFSEKRNAKKEACHMIPYHDTDF